MSDEHKADVADELPKPDNVEDDRFEVPESNISNPKNKNNSFLPQNATNSSCGCAHEISSQMDTTKVSFIYAIGRIEPRFPSLGVEKEYQQVLGRIESKGKTDFESMQYALSQTENRYIARHMCWVLKVEGIETYLLVPRDPSDYDTLINAIR